MLDYSLRSKTPKGVRDYAILRLLFDLALRASELCNLRIKDLDLKRCSIKVQGKGSREAQILTLSSSTIKALSPWLRIKGNADGPLFTQINRSSVNKPLTRQTIYQLVRKYGSWLILRPVLMALDTSALLKHVKPPTKMEYPLRMF